MSTRDFFKNSVLEAFGQVDPAKIGLSLLVALAMGILIYYVYKRFFTGVVYSRSFAVTLVGMCVLTCMVTLAISTNVVISLGMVGALSIVRYRTAVKDPLDLLYLFWAITTGITAGAGMYALVGLTAAVIVVMIAGFASHQDKARVYMMVIHYTGQTTGTISCARLGVPSSPSNLRRCAVTRSRWPSRCSRTALTCPTPMRFARSTALRT